MSEEHGRIRSRLWRGKKLVQEDFPFADISDHLDDEGCLFWVDICNPDGSRLRELADELGLAPLVVDDALASEGRAKATRFPTYTFLTTYATTMVPGPAEELPELRVTRVSAFVLHRGVVTIRHGDDVNMDDVVERWDDNDELLQYGVGALVYGLLDFVVDGHFDAIQAMDDSIESLEDGLFDERAVSREVQHRTYRIRKDLVELRRVVLPMREIINSVLRHRRDLNAPAELDPWYDDLYDHVLRASEWTESLRDMITTVFETNLSLQDARLNTVMKKLTSWAAIIAVPTAVTGYFGQNVPYPGYEREWGFVLSTLVIAGLAALLYFGFRRRDWL